MKPNFFLFALPIGLLIIITTMLESLFIVKEHEQVVITQFGKFVRSQTKAGLDFKTPFIQDVFYYDKRLLDHDITPADVVTRDKRTLVIDNFAKWRITDPEKFYKRTRTTRVAKDRLRDIIFSELRLDFGDNDLNDIISGERSNIMKKVTERSNQKVKELDMGVEIVDVRIMRADFPPENQRAVFERMSAERNRIARQFRSEGDEEAKKIRAETDRERTVILARAYKEEQTLRGQGDAESIKITARAFSQNPGFFEFIRSMDAYRNSITESGKLIIAKDSPFLKYLK